MLKSCNRTTTTTSTTQSVYKVMTIENPKHLNVSCPVVRDLPVVVSCKIQGCLFSKRDNSMKMNGTTGSSEVGERALKLKGYVGFDQIASQHVNKAVKDGFAFNILCIGKPFTVKTMLTLRPCRNSTASFPEYGYGYGLGTVVIHGAVRYGRQVSIFTVRWSFEVHVVPVEQVRRESARAR